MSLPAENTSKFTRTVAIILFVGGVVGIIAAFALTYDKIQVLSNHNYKPSCNINPVLSCGSVMKTKQADLFGVPNTIFGLIGYTAFAMYGALLLTKAKFTKLVWLSLQVGVTVALLFMHYLFFEGIFRIHAICPFCFVIWMITTPIFWYTTIYNIQAGYIKLPKKLRTFILRHHGDILALWYIVIFGILLKEFWYYWKTLI